jgi:hypothetical protein
VVMRVRVRVPVCARIVASVMAITEWRLLQPVHLRG